MIRPLALEAQEVPVSVSRLAQEQRLGAAPLAIYSSSRRASPQSIIVLTLMFLILLTGPLALLPLIPSSRSSWLLALLSIWYILLLSLSLAVLRMLRAGILLLATYPEGFVTYALGSSTAIRWDLIEQLWRGRRGNDNEVQRNQLRLRLQDGRCYKLNMAAEGSADAFDDVEYTFTARLLPTLIAQYTRSQPLTFGGLTLSCDGLTADHETLAWDAIEHIEITSHSLLIKRYGQWWAWYQRFLPDVPNASLLQALLAHIRQPEPAPNEAS